MGHISLSHCKDAIVIVWHKSKIGIDIERTDRNFNYKQLASKYFFNASDFNNRNPFTKTMILNQWCAIEAAIKWDHGKLAKDIKHWQYFQTKKELIQKKKNLHLNLAQINFHNWTIALAYKENNSLNPKIICCSKNF